MRKMLTMPNLMLPAAALLLCAGMIQAQRPSAESLNGAWQLKQDNSEQVLVFIDGYFSQTDYSIPAKTFHYTRGGRFSVDKNTLTVNTEYNTQHKEAVGKKITAALSFKNGKLVVDWKDGKGKQTWTRIDDGKGALAGYWRINGRMQDDAMHPIPLRPRKTIKILSGTRFQWAAINTETGEFFGTGGGTYTFRDGKYTENIEFFSRDGSRVGASLSFDGQVENNTWLHSGLSSKGDPIKETWVRNE